MTMETALRFCAWFCLLVFVRVAIFHNDLTLRLSSSCNDQIGDAPFLSANNATLYLNRIGMNESLVSPTGTASFGALSNNNDTAHLMSTPSRRQPLPPIHVNSSWIGNQWIPPPGYRLYSTREMQQHFGKHSILWVGDSTARRNYGTLFGILNASNVDDVEIDELDHPSVIDINKMTVDLEVPYSEPCHKDGYNLCRKNPVANDKLYDHMDATCFASLANMTTQEHSTFWDNLKDYSLVIFAIGPWELRDRCGPDELGWKKRVDQFLDGLAQKSQTYRNTTFIWRTFGNIDYDIERKAKLSWKKAYEMNEYIKKRIEQQHSTTRTSYIDWGQAMFPRSFPRSKRIRGDMQAHYGLEARLAFCQMLINHVREQERRQEAAPEE